MQTLRPEYASNQTEFQTVGPASEKSREQKNDELMFKVRHSFAHELRLTHVQTGFFWNMKATFDGCPS